jgi:hypothetical protein
MLLDLRPVFVLAAIADPKIASGQIRAESGPDAKAVAHRGLVERIRRDAPLGIARSVY